MLDKEKLVVKMPDMKFFQALEAILDNKNVQSAEEYVIVSLTIDEWRAIRDYVKRAAQPLPADKRRSESEIREEWEKLVEDTKNETLPMNMRIFARTQVIILEWVLNKEGEE